MSQNRAPTPDLRGAAACLGAGAGGAVGLLGAGGAAGLEGAGVQPATSRSTRSRSAGGGSRGRAVCGRWWVTGSSDLTSLTQSTQASRCDSKRSRSPSPSAPNA